MAKINAYITFNGNCKEAMTFYRDCLDAELEIQMVADSPMVDQLPAGSRDLVMHSALKKDDLNLMASDMLMNQKFTQGNNIRLMLICDSHTEINTLFSAFAREGHIDSPLKDEFWGGLHGQLTDKYGIHWMFNYDQPKLAG